MDPIVGGAIMGGTGLASAWANYQANQDTNWTNQAIAGYTNKFNREEATRAMEFSRDMSNTSYQRGVQDLKAAGLNPMLAYAKGGASTPSGNAASASPLKLDSPRPGDVLSGASSSAIAGANLAADLKSKTAQTALTEAATVTEAGKAAQAVNSARESEIRWRLLNANFDSDVARSRLLGKQASYDERMLEFDNWAKRLQAVGNVGSTAVDMVGGVKNIFKKAPNMLRWLR